MKFIQTDTLYKVNGEKNTYKWMRKNLFLNNCFGSPTRFDKTI